MEEEAHKVEEEASKVKEEVACKVSVKYSLF